MALLPALFSIVQVVISFASGLTAFRLYRSGLHRRYPVLFCYMAFLALYALCPVVWDTRGATYFWSWIFAQPVMWLLDILVVRELCRVVLEKYRGLLSLGRWVMYIGVALAAFLSFLSLLPHITSTMPARSRILGYWVGANRGVSLSLVFFLLLMLFAVSRYPVRLSRNVILNAVLFTICFTCDSLGSILKAVFDRRLSSAVNLYASGVEAVCLLVWLWYLTPEGENAHFEWLQFGPEYERRVLGRLDSLNRVVQKADWPGFS
jgi:hypothetical protein